MAETLAAISLVHGSRACRIAEIDSDDPEADRMVLEGIARWCRRFSPIVAIESGERPECIHVDITGTARLFGGEESVVRTVVWTLASRGVHARAAVADTPAAAWAAAHHTAAANTAAVNTAAVNTAAVNTSTAVHAASAVSVGLPASGEASRHAVVAHAISSKGTVRRSRRRDGRSAAKTSRRRWWVVPPGEQSSQLAGLPIASLALGRNAGHGSGRPEQANHRAAAGKDQATAGKDAGKEIVASLAELGVTTIGQLLRLPRKSLASRFGEGLERRLAEFLGTREEPLSVIRDDAFPRADCRLAAPAATLDAIRSVIDGLVGRCVSPLAARGLGVTALQIRLEAMFQRAFTDLGRSDDGLNPSGDEPCPPVVIDIGLFRPSTSVRHLVELVELRLSRMHLPGEIESIAVEVIAAGAVECRQKTLFGGQAEGDAASVEMLLDRLAGRLGRRAVFEPKPVADAQPEHAWMPVSPAGRVPVSPAGRAPVSPAGRAPASPGGERRKKASGKGHVRASAGSSGRNPAAMVPRSRRSPVRPIWLSSRPVRLEAVSVVPDGPPVRFRVGTNVHRVIDAHGPERIETAWWRGECVRRDYYVVETESGSRWWLFRRLRDGAWFLHGQFA